VLTANIGNVCKNTVIKHEDVTFKPIDTSFPTRQKAFHNRMTAKIPKILGWELYPDYDVYIWIDSYFSIKKEETLKWYLDELEDKDALFFRHPFRKTVKEEAEYLLKQMKSGNQYIKDRCEGEDIEGQLATYLADPEFIDDTLISAGTFAYTKKLVENKEWNVMKEWYYHVCRWNIRDQVSLPYVLKKFNIDYALSEENILKTKYLHE